MTAIPDDLKVFSLIYEYRGFVLWPLLVLWLAGGCFWLFKLKKVFFLWLLIFPLVLQPLQIAFVYSGWHYRMELRDRFAKTPHGWHDLDCMPPTIRAEYAKHNYRPRYRLYYAVTSGPDTKCRDNLPFRRRFASYGGTSKRGGFLEEQT